MYDNEVTCKLGHEYLLVECNLKSLIYEELTFITVTEIFIEVGMHDKGWISTTILRSQSNLCLLFKTTPMNVLHKEMIHSRCMSCMQIWFTTL